MKYAIKRDRTTLVLGDRSLVSGERYLYQSKKYGRYYVKGKDDVNDGLKLFVTKNLKKAKEVLAGVHEVWTTDFYIVSINDDGTELKID